MKKWNNPGWVLVPTVAVALMLGLVDCLKAIGADAVGPVHNLLNILPLAGVGLGWMVPTLIVVATMHFADGKVRAARSVS